LARLFVASISLILFNHLAHTPVVLSGGFQEQPQEMEMVVAQVNQFPSMLCTVMVFLSLNAFHTFLPSRLTIPRQIIKTPRLQLGSFAQTCRRYSQQPFIREMPITFWRCHVKLIGGVTLT
jgi:hypothetical protein